MSNTSVEFSSFRDPSGYIFRENGQYYRQINYCYQSQYEALMSSGLYENLIAKKWMVSHTEKESCQGDVKYKTILPSQIPFISYPYEWSFSALRDGAILTLNIHKIAMQHGMILKDASAYNVQFLQGSPIFIDTLSFDFYEKDTPWGAYGQFCRHFLAPLLMMAHVDIHLNRLLQCYVDGIPLEVASHILKKRGGLFAKMHIHMHAASIQRYAEVGKEKAFPVKARATLSNKQHLAIIDNLIHGIEQLKVADSQTEWGDYYKHTNYTNTATKSKEQAVLSFLKRRKLSTVWDFGANDGRYSELAFQSGATSVVAFDIDHTAVDIAYRKAKRENVPLLALMMDFTNPSPSIGFANRERENIEKRSHPDCIMALAFIHHLAISNNLSFNMIAAWLSDLSNHLIIEFVPKEDSQVQLLLKTRTDIFPDYYPETFERVFSEYYQHMEKVQLEGSQRTLYMFDN